ncbi:MAG: GNAT family acetyltransferase [Solirubrobacteraceae bacterium]|jgi:ribosomal protein S18 acetylase RimI-like enzyme
MAMRIEVMSDERTDEAIALWQEAGLTRPWNDPAGDLRRALDGPASTVLAGVEEGHLVATAMVGHDGHRGWVYYFAVSSASRRRGHGKALMQACEEWLARRGIPKLNLMIRGENLGARDFYAALGFGPDDVVVLSRRLG